MEKLSEMSDRNLEKTFLEEVLGWRLVAVYGPRREDGELTERFEWWDDKIINVKNHRNAFVADPWHLQLTISRERMIAIIELVRDKGPEHFDPGGAY